MTMTIKRRRGKSLLEFEVDDEHVSFISHMKDIFIPSARITFEGVSIGFGVSSVMLFREVLL